MMLYKALEKVSHTTSVSPTSFVSFDKVFLGWWSQSFIDTYERNASFFLMSTFFMKAEMY